MPQGQQIASLFATVGCDLTGLTSGLSQARGHLDGFAGQMASVGGSMQRVGGVLTAAVTTPIVGAGVASLKMAADFESATNILAIAARQSGTPLEDLHDAALLVGKDAQLIGVDAMQAADAMTTFYKTGFTTSEVMGDLNTYLEEETNLTGMLRAAIDLAAASDLDLARASDAVAIAIKTFGLNSEDATAVANSFVGAADASVAEVSDLTDAMYTFGPTANQYGWSLQDANTALAILSERGIRGSEAGTALRSMMTNMMRDTDDTTAALDALNISLYDQEGQMRTLPDIMGQLTQALSGLSDEERNYYIQTLAGTYGMKAMATLVAEGPEGWAEMEKKIAEAATAQEVGEQRTRGMTGALEQFQGALQTLGITAGETFLPKVTEAVEGTTNLVDALAGVSPEALKAAIGLAGVAAAAGPMLLVVGSLLKVLPVFTTPLGGLTVLLLGLAGALWLAGEDGVTFRDGLHELGQELQKREGLEEVGLWIDRLATLTDWLAAVGEGARGMARFFRDPFGALDQMTEEKIALYQSAGITPEDEEAYYREGRYLPEWARRGLGLSNRSTDTEAALNELVDMIVGPETARLITFTPQGIEIVVGSMPMSGEQLSSVWADPAMWDLIDKVVPPEGYSADVGFRLAQTAEETATLAEQAAARARMLEGQINPGGGVGLDEYGPEIPAGYYPLPPEGYTEQTPNTLGGIGSQPYGPEEMKTPALDQLFGEEDVALGFSLTPAQTPEEVAALAESVLPPEGSLTRSVTIAARADPAQLERSADEVAAAWERAIAQRLERLKRNKMVETGGLLEEAAAVGMAR